MIKSLTVRQLNTYVKSVLDGDVLLNAVSVIGEISNFKYYSQSGHCYFTLKDGFSSIKCVMFKSSFDRCKVLLDNGLSVNCFGKVSLYEKDGTYQLYVEYITDPKSGNISENLEELKKKLSEEGLFDESSKRPIPQFPNEIAVITSDNGAVKHDILSVAERRYPLVKITFIYAGVQGEKAENQIVSALEKAYLIDSVDLIIIARGGGSEEDLYVFNSEKVARTVFASPVPVISAVGHQTDYTVCDLVADKRAATPSAAAELALPDVIELNNFVNKMFSHISYLTTAKFELSKTVFSNISSRFCFTHPEFVFSEHSQNIDSLFENIENLLIDKIETNSRLVSDFALKIDSLSPMKILSRGFASVTKDGKNVLSKNELNLKDKLKITLSDGSVNCEVIK